MKESYKYIFVILVYKNTDDLFECISSVQKSFGKSKVIVVNAYYDDKITRQVKKISDLNGCDFLNQKNLGYGYGNNYGIRYAFENYIFSYLIVLNPDTLFEKSIDLCEFNENVVIAPKVITLSGKNQNPIFAVESELADKLIFYGFQKQNKLLYRCGTMIHKINRIIFQICVDLPYKKCHTIYGGHGCCLIFSYSALEVLNFSPFDEQMFLFQEEFVLAKKCKDNAIKIVYEPKIVIRHKEDGSLSKTTVSIWEESRKSYLYYYHQYMINGR